MRSSDMRGAAVACAALLSSATAFAAEDAPETEPAHETAASTGQKTLAATPSGVDTYTAFLGERGVGAAGLGAVEAAPGDTALGGGVRIWGGFLGRVTAQGEAARNEKGRFAPSLAVAVRALGDRKSGLSLGVLGRYRTEGFSTIDGEVEGGLLGSYARRALHLDAGLLAGVGVEEEEADGEALLRFGYDALSVLRIGFEARVRLELEEEGEEAMRPPGEAGEWDAFGGLQTSVAYDHFFATLTVGPQKRRSVEDVGVMAHVIIGGVAF